MTQTMDHADDFVAARATAILDQRRKREAAPEGGRRWWLVGLVMFGLGLATGLTWWLLANIPGFEPLPRLLG